MLHTQSHRQNVFTLLCRSTSLKSTAINIGCPCLAIKDNLPCSTPLFRSSMRQCRFLTFKISRVTHICTSCRHIFLPARRHFFDGSIRKESLINRPYRMRRARRAAHKIWFFVEEFQSPRSRRARHDAIPIIVQCSRARESATLTNIVDPIEWQFQSTRSRRARLQ